MKYPRYRTRGSALALACSLTLFGSCGGGGGIDGSGYVAGPITTVETFVVAGITLDTSGANVLVDGVDASVADLRAGMVVEVRGNIDRVTATGSAMDIAFERDMAGPIQSIDSTSQTFMILGQAVRVLSSTEFDGGAFEDLREGSNVVVSGLRDASETLRATFVGLDDDEIEIELRGRVRDFDAGLQTFRIGAQNIDFNGAMVSGGSVAEDLLVEVESNRGVVGGFLLADSIEIESERPIQPGDEVEAEGFITAVLSETQFELDSSFTVRIVPSTEFSGGTVGDIALNRFVETEGTVDGNGAIRAESIEFEIEEDEEEDEDE